MAHHCKDCSYRGEKSGQLGECPACGSFNIVQRSSNVVKEQPSAANWRLVVLVLLWSCLIVMVIRKLIH